MRTASALKKMITIWSFGLLFTTGVQANTAEDGADLLANLKNVKTPLLKGIEQASRQSGVPISAKFEMDGNDVSLSIYTAPQGLSVNAEMNQLTELSGSATTSQYVAMTEIFADKEHIARAAMQLTVMQMSKFGLAQIIIKANAAQAGIVYSIKNPMVRNGQPVADVLIADRGGKSILVTVNLLTGLAYK